MSPYSYLRNIFRADAAKNGGIVRRSVDDVQKYASHKYLVEAVTEKGFHLLETGDQYVIICNSGLVKMHC